LPPSGAGVTVAVNVTGWVASAGLGEDDSDVTVGTVTWTLNDLFAVLPWASVAEQFTVVVPTPTELPDAGVQATGREPSTRSVAVAV
jgi:hypothetical protein